MEQGQKQEEKLVKQQQVQSSETSSVTGTHDDTGFLAGALRMWKTAKKAVGLGENNTIEDGASKDTTPSSNNRSGYGSCN